MADAKGKPAVGPDWPDLRALRALAKAAGDRDQAAIDRSQAAEDRVDAVADRARAKPDRERAGHDRAGFAGSP